MNSENKKLSAVELFCLLKTMSNRMLPDYHTDGVFQVVPDQVVEFYASPHLILLVIAPRLLCRSRRP